MKLILKIFFILFVVFALAVLAAFLESFGLSLIQRHNTILYLLGLFLAIFVPIFGLIIVIRFAKNSFVSITNYYNQNYKKNETN